MTEKFPTGTDFTHQKSRNPCLSFWQEVYLVALSAILHDRIPLDLGLCGPLSAIACKLADQAVTLDSTAGRIARYQGMTPKLRGENQE